VTDSKTRATTLQRLAIRLAAVTIVGGASVAGAQPSVQLSRFTPSEQTNDGFAVSSAEVQGDMRFGAQFYIDYANDPLVYELTRGDTDTEAFSVVEHQLTGNLNASLGIRDRLTVSIGLPIVFLQNGEDIPANLGAVGVVDGDGTTPGVVPIYLADGFALGDLWVGGRVRLFGDTESVFMLSAEGRLIIPTATIFDDGQHYAGERGVAGAAGLIAQINVGRFRLMANLGAHLRPDNADCRDLPGTSGPGANCFYGARQGDEFTYGIGATVRLLDDTDLRAILEVHGRTTFQNFFDREETPFELLAGLKYTHSSGLTAGIGGGPGLVRGFGSPDFRVFAMVGYTEPTAGTVIRLDTDGDGIYDDEDQCVNEPEDVDGFEDTEGCPDPDNDGDGILDGSDQCPMEPEDTDGFEDENGCPDPDNDGDGILDASDAVPDRRRGHGRLRGRERLPRARQRRRRHPGHALTAARTRPDRRRTTAARGPTRTATAWWTRSTAASPCPVRSSSMAAPSRRTWSSARAASRSSRPSTSAPTATSSSRARSACWTMWRGSSTSTPR
jgi:hypothetical protein